MQVKVIFGSTSDQTVYEPLCLQLQDLGGVKVSFEVCSAHREPQRLSAIVQAGTCDLYVAGAGLAAHLPGVLASQTLTPVIGLPVDGVLQGQDALLSILQMPRGVPVLTAGVGQIDHIVNFVGWYKDHRDQPPVFQIFHPEWGEKLVAQFKAPLEKLGWRFIKVSSELDHPPSLISLVFADIFNPPKVAGQGKTHQSIDRGTIPWRMHGVSLGVPVFAQPPYVGDLRLLGQIADLGGLWVGVNNITNLQIALLELWPIGSQAKALIKTLRGELQHAAI